MRTLAEDLATLVATGIFPERPDDGWREFSPKAWVEVRVEGRGRPRTGKRVLQSVSRDGVVLRLDDREEKLFRERLDGTERDCRRVEREGEAATVDGRALRTRVFEATWKRLDHSFAERRWIAQGTLVRRELIETGPDGTRVTHGERLVKWDDPVRVGGQEIPCRLIERTVVWSAGRSVEKLWISDAVPGHVVRRVRTDASGGESTIVTAFGLR